MVNFVSDILGVPVPLSGTIEYYILVVFSCAIVLSFAVALVRFLLAPIDIAARFKKMKGGENECLQLSLQKLRRTLTGLQLYLLSLIRGFLRLLRLLLITVFCWFRSVFLSAVRSLLWRIV